MGIALPMRTIPLPLIGLLLLGCGSSEGGESSSNTVELAMIPKTSNNLVFAMGNDGAQFAARFLSRGADVDIEVEYIASPELDPRVQRGLIRDAIAAEKHGLIVSCIDESISEPIDEAVDAGIPVITYDSDCPDSERLGFYSMHSEDTGAKAADLLAAAMGEGEKNVAILTGRAGADNLERRAAAFEARIADEYPDVTVVTTVNCMETADSCGPAVEEEIVAAYPDLDGLFVVGLWGLEAACSCSESGLTCICEDDQMPNWKAAARGKLKTVAYDALPFQLELMSQGYVAALVGQKYFGWGYDTVSILHGHLTEGRQVEDFIDSGFDLVCPNNVEDMKAKWRAADFTVPLSPECDL